MSQLESPAIAFRFPRLVGTFDRFATVIDSDPERAFMLYMQFKELAGMIDDDAVSATGHPTHFTEEAGRVMGWMRFALGFSESPGDCRTHSAAKYILDRALQWG